MKKTTALIVVGMAVVLLVAVVSAQNKGPGFTGTETPAQYAPYKKVWIISVGISQYKNSAYNLQYAAADAKAIAQTFSSTYLVPQSQIRVVLDAEATVMGIKRAFSSIQQQVGVDDGVIIYFSGHGLDYPLPSGGKMGYLVPFEGNMDDPFSTCLDMDVIRKMADLLRAKHVIFLVDSCYSGIAGTQKSATSTAAMAEVARMSKLPTRQLITAGRGSERALELPHLRHSAFTYWMLSGLRGQADGNKDGFVLASELFMYLNPKVKTETSNAQTPQMFALPGGQEGDFIFKLDINREAHEAAAEVGALEQELAALKQRAATAAKMKDAAIQREIEREQLRTEAALKEAKLREDAARREKELQTKAHADARARSAEAEMQSAEAKARTEQLQRDAQAMREKLGTGGTSTGRTVAEGLAEYRKISWAFVDLDKRYAEEYAAQTKPIDDYYGQKIRENQPAPKDQFETDAQYQERKKRANSIVTQLTNERDTKKSEIQNSIISVIESQKTALQEQILEIEKITEPVPRSAVSFQLSQYSAEVQTFGLSCQVLLGENKVPFAGQLAIPVDKARIYAGEPTLLIAEASVGIENGEPTLASLTFYGSNEMEKYEPENLHAEGWVDYTTGLIWQVSPSGGKMTWKAAKSHCASLNLGGSSGWRLPTISEHRSLIRGCPATQTGGDCSVTDSCLTQRCLREFPALHVKSDCNGCSYNGGPGQDGAYWPPELSGEASQYSWYWSSSAVAPPGQITSRAWAVHVPNGLVGTYGTADKGYNIKVCHARCVR